MHCRQTGAWRGTKRRRGAPLLELDATPDGIEDEGATTLHAHPDFVLSSWL